MLSESRTSDDVDAKVKQSLINLIQAAREKVIVSVASNRRAKKQKVSQEKIDQMVKDGKLDK